MRGTSNEVLSFDYTEEKLFLPLKQKLEELYGKATKEPSLGTPGTCRTTSNRGGVRYLLLTYEII